MTAPRYLSLFSGAGGIDLGLDNAGWSCVGQCEIDDTARSVLARHWPDVPRWTDVRDVAHADQHGRRGPVGSDERSGSTHSASGDPRTAWARVDLIVGGFPCQDVSVAGRRAGLAGERSGLWWEFHRIVESVRPRAVLVENVEGLLSSNGGRDMGAILDALVDLGYGAAWRVLDAQHFGVPQRRRRVFLLALTGGRVGAERAASVLALTPGSAGDPAPRRGTRTGVAGGVGRSVVGALTGRSASRLDDACAGGGQLVPTTATGSIAHTLKAGGHNGSEDGTGRGVPIVVNALDCKRGGPDDNSAQANHLTPTHSGVRRLTPRECERLMGWPDDHTRYAADGREIADSRRYAMCGNGVVAPVAEWIGARLAWELARDNEFESAA